MKQRLNKLCGCQQARFSCLSCISFLSKPAYCCRRNRTDYKPTLTALLLISSLVLCIRTIWNTRISFTTILRINKLKMKNSSLFSRCIDFAVPQWNQLPECLACLMQVSDDQSLQRLGLNGQTSFKANELLSLPAYEIQAAVTLPCRRHGRVNHQVLAEGKKQSNIALIGQLSEFKVLKSSLLLFHLHNGSVTGSPRMLHKWLNTAEAALRQVQLVHWDWREWCVPSKVMC